MTEHDPIDRLLRQWQADIDAVPWPTLVTSEEALAIVARGRHHPLRTPRWCGHRGGAATARSWRPALRMQRIPNSCLQREPL
ncbi:hypothetical protein [Amycolatopsis magusensis]|uniref:hypothetical protein n=1 Tax=Amycolatopsis magusensis TaxID=882444 RepID=UPI00379AF5CF